MNTVFPALSQTNLGGEECHFIMFYSGCMSLSVTDPKRCTALFRCQY